MRELEFIEISLSLNIIPLQVKCVGHMALTWSAAGVLQHVSLSGRDISRNLEDVQMAPESTFLKAFEDE